MKQIELINYCNELLGISSIRDYCPNGLQVEGDNREVKKIALGVSISLDFIKKAAESHADLIITHHGMIWDKDSRRIQGPFRNRLQELFKTGLAAAAYHLPLDFHPELGNNIQLAKLIGLKEINPITAAENQVVAVMGVAEQDTIAAFSALIEQKLKRKPLVLPFGKEKISKVVIITGGAQGHYLTAVENGADCFLTGEASEMNFAMSQEYKFHYISAGHHATEKFGILALGEHIQRTFDIATEFIDSDNPL